MKIRKIIRLTAVVLLMCVTQVALAESGKALVNGDYVRVRARPNTEANEVGFLYKNMVVEIKAQTPEEDRIGKDSFHWYEVKSNDLRGWVYGKFLNPSVTNWNVDTYDAPGNTQWLTRRFGDNTWYYNQNMNMKSFSLDDYRNLMRAAETGNEQAWVALRATILPHLQENPNDPDFAYLKKHLYSEKFLKAVIKQPYAYNDPQFFDVVPYSRDLVVAALKNSDVLVSAVPGEYWNDKEIVLLALRSCNQACMSAVPDGLARDKEVAAALAKCGKPKR